MKHEKKLIYADDLLSTLRDDKSINGANLRRVIQHINAAPAVDAVVHGRWNKIAYFPYYCSVCDEIAPLDFEGESHYKSNYCPNCGAKMDGGNEDGK